MPMKKRTFNSEVVQDCEGEQSEGKTAVQSYKAVHKDRTLGRGKESANSPDPVAPRGQGPNPSRKGDTMPIIRDEIRLSKQKQHTEVRIQYGNEPARVLVFSFPVEVDVRPLTKRAA